MIRKFCDLCDTLIDNDDRTWNFELRETTLPGVGYQSDFIMDDTARVSPTTVKPMICVTCAKVISWSAHKVNKAAF